MQIVRTVLWVLLFVILLIFSYNNWTTVPVKIWEELILETKVAALVVISFLLGLLPMWLYHRSANWRQNRRIRSLQQAAAALMPAEPAEPVHPETHPADHTTETEKP